MAARSFTANALNQYSAIDETREPEYDLSGNMTSDDAGRTFSFDSENHLASGTKAGAETAYFYYGYDPFGRRVRKTVEIGYGILKERYVYDGPQCIAECDDAGVVLRKFIYGPGMDEPLVMINVSGETETRYYYHRDALGSVMALSDANGDIKEGYTYSAFGIATVNTSAGTDGDWLTRDGATSDESYYGNPYMFTGRRYDPESGLYYYRARYYDPSLGRFISADPISYAGGINLYAYCMNNPINWYDPYGMASLQIIIGKGLAIQLDIGWSNGGQITIAVSLGLGIGLSVGYGSGDLGASTDFGGGGWQFGWGGSGGIGRSFHAGGSTCTYTTFDRIDFWNGNPTINTDLMFHGGVVGLGGACHIMGCWEKDDWWPNLPNIELEPYANYGAAFFIGGGFHGRTTPKPEEPKPGTYLPILPMGIAGTYWGVSTYENMYDPVRDPYTGQIIYQP